MALGGAAQWVCTAVAALQCPVGPVGLTQTGGGRGCACLLRRPLPAGAGSKRGDWGCSTGALHAGQSTWAELSPMLPTHKEDANNGAH